MTRRKKQPKIQTTSSTTTTAVYGHCPQCGQPRGIIPLRDNLGRPTGTIIGCWNTECTMVGT